MEEFQDDIISYFEENCHKDSNYDEIFKVITETFLKSKLPVLFEYILKTKSDTRLLDKTIRCINNLKLKDSLNSLVDFILRPSNESSFLDLKVLAIKTISVFKDTSCVQALLYCLNDKNSNYKIRLAAADALGKIGDKAAFETLGKVASDEEEKSVYVRESAASALGMLGDNRALDIFESIINTKQMFLDKFSYLKEKIVEAMSKLDIERDKKAYEILKNSLLDQSESVRIAAIETIMNSNIENSYELIYERLRADDSIEVKKNALVALYNISDRLILDEVVNGEYPDEIKNYAKEIIEEYEND